MSYKEMFSIIAIVLTFISFYPYIRSILLGRIRPHVFSWVIWGGVTFIVFFAQLQDDGGAGAWPIGMSGVISLFVAAMAYSGRKLIRITRTDWLFLCVAMSSLPIWYVTADPLWAVIILSVVDLTGFGPTIRKSYHEPFGESRLFYLLFATRNALSIVALENYSLTTVLFPAAAGGACIVLVAAVTFRRRKLTVNKSR